MEICTNKSDEKILNESKALFVDSKDWLIVDSLICNIQLCIHFLFKIMILHPACAFGHTFF
ncbi:MAG: hypothetical protein K5790_02680 [Nitrosopumilus sp.]|uniref:hypothetical protein n=1 Tax=Nitrosopumilus sp. TaxID=2024843 RepID=UPI00247EBA21|nr:hypothetical protein [Nitrosopumilus sp.]MCV0392182.1 hypothetical protein [Nitrosopumilus sp.]